MGCPHFSPKAISFLRALRRNNDRDWFRERKDQYEEHLRAPMLAVIEHLAEDFQTFAPELVASPKGIFRIYRDTRFASDKAPLKTSIAAVFPWRGLDKMAGAALYFEVSDKHVWAGGGLHTPDTRVIAGVREHIAGNHKRLTAIIDSPGFRKTIGALEGEQLQRVPRGFDKEHPAADLLRHKQFLAGKEFPAAFAYDPKFYPGLLAVFTQVAPLVRFLNEPIA